MAELNIDFEGTGDNGTGGQAGGGNQSNGGGAATTKEDVTSLGGGDVVDINKQNGGGSATPPADGEGNDGNDGNNGGEGTGEEQLDSSTGELEAGTNVDFEGNTYTVAENGDLVDKDGNVFKAAAEVKDWMDSLETEEDNPLSISAIQEALGTEIQDEAGNPVEFSNDAQGVQAYVNAVIELKSKEIQEGAINKLYADNPMLKQFQDYVTLNGSPIGFGELPDRSGIEID